MNIRRPLLIAGAIVLLQTIHASPCLGAIASDTCDNPIQINSLIITNSICGDSTGVILLNLVGGNAGYAFNWTPGVSDSNIGFGLKAAVYHIEVVNIDHPECTLDTVVVVNNSNGPAIQVSEVLPANCTGSNGKITLKPDQYNYTWSNGKTGAINENLNSGCYSVTATDPANGCYSVLRICVPNTNPLQSTFEIITPSKCDLPTGTAKVNVTGGSGQYTYSFGNSPVVPDLPPGVFTYFVSDDLTGCKDTVHVVMYNAPLEGTVNIHPVHIKCPGSDQGSVGFDVVPGSNFTLPFTFAIWDENGDTQSPDDLKAGIYYLQIADADSCLLPVDTFKIVAPPAFSAQQTVQAGTCNQGGRIELNLTGGNGGFITDWSDLPGINNPKNRQELTPGYYHATVYDSLFCSYPIDSVLVISYCGIPDTFLLVLGTGTTDSICLPLPAGVNATGLSYSIIGTNNPVYGAWSLNSSGCAVYKAGSVPVFGADPICIAVQAAAPGFGDTVCIVVNITTLPPEHDSIYFSVPQGNSSVACGFVPANFNNRKVSSLNGTGLSGISDAFGNYVINALSACMTFQSAGPAGYQVDYVGVAVCDTVLRQCRTICYIPSVHAQDGCRDGVFFPDSLVLSASDCDEGADACVPVPFSQINEYVILDNGVPYTGNQFSGCDPKTRTAYTVNLNAGPYHLSDWNGQPFSGTFTNAYELLSLLNQYDPAPGWSLENDSVFVGGDAGQTYGPLNILSAQDQAFKINPTPINTFLGTVMRFATGAHVVTFRREKTGCSDTVQVKVVCTGCPPIHNYTPNSQGQIAWNILNCFSDTIFCTNISNPELGDFSISDHGAAFSSFAACGSFIGLRLDTGYHNIRLLNNITFCEYNVEFDLACSGGPVGQNLKAVPDEVATPKNTSIEMDLIANDTIRGIMGNRSGLADFDILTDPDFGQLTYDDFFAKVTYSPNLDFCGVDTFVYQITDTAGLRSSARVRVNVLCNKILIYNGISPNNDGRNDVWHMPGIELYPDNEVQIFNRWGNLVFKRKGYTNQQAWDGTWDGHNLPDGAYFYVIDLGDGSKAYSGYIQLQR